MKCQRAKLSQKEFPRETLAKALVIGEAIWENFAGKGAAPHEIALALELSPTSGGWRSLCGTSIAYGLTEGGYNANEITLTDLGRRIVAPEDDGDDELARVEAILQPTKMGEFLKKYNKAKFPKENIAQNVLIGMGLPKERAEKSVEIIRENGIYTGILKETKTGLFVALGSPASPPKIEDENINDGVVDEDLLDRHVEEDEEKFARRISENKESEPKPVKPVQRNSNVFISHGKNKKVVQQLKELLTFGKFNPVVSVEKETASIPVPEKVFEDMRECSAAVIHLEAEQELLDPEGNKHSKINENVLIEIGAAIALYNKNFVLLVKKGVKLPSNLQGLYRSEYEGDALDYEATMKLLKTFNQFK